MNRADESIAIQLAACARSPRKPGLWAVLARRYLAANRPAEAVGAAERALALDARNPAARAIRAEAIAALEQRPPGLAALELTAVLRAEDPRAHLDLGHAYVDVDRPADAERCFKRALELEPDLPEALAGLAAVYLSVGIEDGAEHYAKRALEVSPGQAVASQTLAAILEKRGEGEAAAALLDAAYARQSLFVEPARESRATVLVLATQTQGNIPYRFLLPAERYTRLVWFMEHAREEQLAEAPAFDLVFNTIGDPDLGAPTREIVARVMAGSGRPALNDPAKVARTHRHLLPELLADLEDVVAPRAARIEASALARDGLAKALAGAGLAPPVLVRPVGGHGGKGLERIDTPEALAKLDRAFDGDLYATRYHPYEAADGRFRKGRMVFVDRRPYPYHWAISPHWLVHYDTSGMGGDAARQAEELRYLEETEAFLGPRAFAAVAAIGERIDLDYCGLDFSLLPDGRVLVFEANATMLVHPEEPDGEFAYKNPAVARITEAFQQMVARRTAEAG